MASPINPDKAPDRGETSTNTIIRNILLCLALTMFLVGVLDHFWGRN